MQVHHEPVHRSIVAVDIEQFGGRIDPILTELRWRLDEYLRRATGWLEPSR